MNNSVKFGQIYLYFSVYSCSYSLKVCFYHHPFVWFCAASYRSCFWGSCVPGLRIRCTSEIFQYSNTMPSSVWERQTALVPKLWHARGVITQARLPHFSLRRCPEEQDSFRKANVSRDHVNTAGESPSAAARRRTGRVRKQADRQERWVGSI